MRSSDLKEYIVDNECLDTILEELGCKSITSHNGYFTCANPDGNNKSAVVVYLNTNLTTINYTRNIAKNKQSADIFDLVSFYKDCSFPEALKYVHSILGLDYYSEPEQICESLQILKMLKDMLSGDEDEERNPIKPISEKILSYYLPYGNNMFAEDNINLDVQHEFEIGYDSSTNYITIPIRDSIGTLCGIKGRYFGEPDDFHTKYTYIEKCNKSMVLYGYFQNINYIKNSNYILIFEAEKSVLQCASYGIRNCVALGGKTISKSQAELIVRTGCTPVIALDQGIDIEEIKRVTSVFPNNMPVHYIFDEDGILEDKQSPSDNFEKFQYLLKNNIYKMEDRI